MNDQKLIMFVQARPALYNKADPRYYKRDSTRALWQECAAELDMEVEQVKKRWFYLRDYFMRQFRWMKGMKSGLSASRRKKWPMYDSLTFLIPYLEPRETLNIHDDFSHMGSHDMMKDECPNFPVDETSSVQSSRSESIANVSLELPEETDYRRLLRKRRSESPSFCRDVFQGLNQPETCDENDHFFKSLVPMLRNLEPIVQMECRVDIQNVVLKHMRRSSRMRPHCAPKTEIDVDVDSQPTTSSQRGDEHSYER